jgi:hypothetical protein
MAYTTAQRKVVLTRLGFRVTSAARYTQAIKDFQRGWNLGAALTVDGRPGPKTDEALAKSNDRWSKHLPTASTHFGFIEFQCKCGGRYSSCRRIWVTRTLLQRLEKYRAATRRSLKIISGCRCPGHNRAVGGASRSQHLYGKACDVIYYSGWTATKVKSLHLFTGIGKSRRTNLVRHVDVRSNASVNNPTIWNYAS